ncbi:CesT family type III secretion system chaperone [Desulfovibrionales bacterium]
MSVSQHAANAITNAAGWTTASPDEHGVFHFHLEEGLDMDFFCPDGRMGILRSTLEPLPDADQEAEHLIRRYAQHAVAVCKKRKSILSLESGHVQLHRTFRLDTLTKEEISLTVPRMARDFLNDLAWWRTALGRHQHHKSSSPFSLSEVALNWSLGR